MRRVPINIFVFVGFVSFLKKDSFGGGVSGFSGVHGWLIIFIGEPGEGGDAIPVWVLSAEFSSSLEVGFKLSTDPDL
jgi:hypothetical protein